MSNSIDYASPSFISIPLQQGEGAMPRVFGAPGRYVQGRGVIAQAGHYLSRLGFNRSAVLGSARCFQAEGAALLTSMRKAGLAAEELKFGGECSLEEISAQRDVILALPEPVDSVVVIGGGKAVDAGRAIAQRLNLKLAVIPSLASNDAPCAAASVIYTPEGETADAELYDSNPALVLVDSAVVAAAGERYLAAGMGDAMATWYEARATSQNPAGINVLGSRPTLAGTALARLCADTLYSDGIDAMASLRAGQTGESFERIVEANVLLSGLGYESGGIAASHAFAQGYTMIRHVHENFLHGEMVAMGVVAQLCLEGDTDEAEKAASFFARVGLPIELGQLGLAAKDVEPLRTIVDGALAFPFLGNMGCDTTHERMLESMLQADVLGASVNESAL